MTPCTDTLRSDLSDPSSESRSHPVSAAAPSMYTATRYMPTQNAQFSLPGTQSCRRERLCSCGAGWQRKCTQPRVHPPETLPTGTAPYCHQQARQPDSIRGEPVLSNSCASRSSASSMHLVAVVAKRGPRATF